MISDRYRCIFVHVPRVAGTSIELALTGIDWWNTVHLPGICVANSSSGQEPDIDLSKQNSLIGDLADIQPKHLSAHEICQYHGNLWKDYYSFAFVRNPWDRLVSLYKSLESVFSACKVQSSSWAPWQKYVLGCFEARGYLNSDFRFLDFENFVRKYHPLPWESSHKTQVGFLRQREGLQQLDFIGRFENLEEDFEFVCEKIGFPSPKLEKGNSSDRGPYRDYYDSATREFVAKEYAEDCRQYGYAF